MRKEDIDLTKQHLSIEETYTLASNLNRIEDVRNAQRIHSDADAVLGLILGVLALPLGVLFAKEMLVTSSTFFETLFTLLVTGIGFAIDILFIGANWRMLTGKW